MPLALSEISAVINSKELNSNQKLSLLLDFDRVLGLGMQSWQQETVQITPELEELLEQRKLARANKDWAGADKLREQIKALGFEVKDGPEGQKLTVL